MNNKAALLLFSRYLSLLIIGAFTIQIFYFILTPLTVYPVFGLISFFDSRASLLAGTLIFFKGNYASIIPACIAGAAYYLLLILNLSTPMDTSQRIKSISILFSSFLLLNILRITLFIFLLSSGFAYFDLAHKFIWYFGSTAMVVAIWFFNVWLLEIRAIPVFTDAKRLLKEL